MIVAGCNMLDAQQEKLTEGTWRLGGAGRLRQWNFEHRVVRIQHLLPEHTALAVAQRGVLAMAARQAGQQNRTNRQARAGRHGKRKLNLHRVAGIELRRNLRWLDVPPVKLHRNSPGRDTLQLRA